MNTPVLSAGVEASARRSPAQASIPGNSHRNAPLSEADLASPEMEHCVLGCILHDADFCFPILEREGIGPRHFHDLRNQALFRLMRRMRLEKLGIDVASVHARGSNEGMFRRPEEVALLAGLPSCVPSHLNLQYYLPELKEKHERRLVLDVSRTLENLAGRSDVPVNTLLADAENAVTQLRQMTAPKEFTIRSVGELLEEPLDEADNILGDRLLARGQSFTLIGSGGIGKSRLLLQLAVSCITGRPFVGLRTHQRQLRWLVIQAENSIRRLQVDLQNLRRWVSEDEWHEVGERLFIQTVEKGEDSFLQLNMPGVKQRLRGMMRKYSPDVVCFDPLNCFAVGELNNDRDMRDTCLAMQRICREDDPRRAIVVLHHSLTGKAGAARATGFDRASFGRNSKLLHAWTRGQINIAPASGDNNQQLIVSCGKCSNGEEFAPFGIRLNPATMIYEADDAFNVRGWERTMEGEREDPVTPLLELCRKHEGISRKEAVLQLVQNGHSRAAAYRLISQAIDLGLVAPQGANLRAVE